MRSLVQWFWIAVALCNLVGAVNVALWLIGLVPEPSMVGFLAFCGSVALFAVSAQKAVEA